MRVMRQQEELHYHQLLRLCCGDHKLLEAAFRIVNKSEDAEIQFKDIVQVIRQMQRET